LLLHVYPGIAVHAIEQARRRDCTGLYNEDCGQIAKVPWRLSGLPQGDHIPSVVRIEDLIIGQEKTSSKEYGGAAVWANRYASRRLSASPTCPREHIV
jgi:hypothetical protein